MDNRQAKEILLGYRPGVDDANDPLFREAIQQLAHDPVLTVWFEQQQRADEEVRAKLRDLPVPVDLKDRLLGERKVVRAEFRWRYPAAFAAAAAVVLLGLIAIKLMTPRVPPQPFAEYSAKMIRYVARGYPIEVKATTFEELRRHFSELKWPSNYVVPERLRSVTVEGGNALTWNENHVCLLCMKDEDTPIWLFVIPNSALSDPPSQSTPEFGELQNLPTAVWTLNGNTYLLSAKGGEAFLKNHL